MIKSKEIPLKLANNDLLMYNKAEVEYEAIQKRADTAKEPSKPLQDGQKVNTAIDIRS